MHQARHGGHFSGAGRVLLLSMLLALMLRPGTAEKLYRISAVRCVMLTTGACLCRQDETYTGPPLGLPRGLVSCCHATGNA